MTSRLRIGIAAAAALLLTACGLMRLLAASTWIWPVVGVVVVATASGELARRVIRPRPLVVLVQVACVFWYDTVVLAHSVALWHLLPDGRVLTFLVDMCRQGSTDISNTVPGDPSKPGITAILVLSLGALAILIDALAATYAMAPLAGLPLLALYLVPATRESGGYDWLAFVLAAAGYTALLSSEGRERLGRWGRPLVHAGRKPENGENGAPGRPARVDTGPIAATGHQITIIALCAAVLAPIFIPTVTSGLFGLGPDNGGSGGNGGNGSGSGTVKLNTQVDLKAFLTGPDTPLLRYHTSPPASGEYIRLQTDDVYDGKNWVPEPNPKVSPIASDGRVGVTPPGLAPTVAQTKVTTRITYQAPFESSTGQKNAAGQYLAGLAAPYPAVSVQAGPAQWNVDTANLAVTGLNTPSKGFAYTVVSDDANPTSAQRNASAKLTADQVDQLGLSDDLKLPSDLPPIVRSTAQAVVGTVTKPFDQAVLLQNYLNSRPFIYSTSVPAQPTASAAMNYLLTNYKGYCQHYSETMMAMARVLQIPARIAVGFTAGKVDAKGDYSITTHDFHAWPELYFDGLGWLRFEPTAGLNASNGVPHGSVPAYAHRETPTTGETAAPSATSAPAFPGAPATGDNCTAIQHKSGICDSKGPEAAAKAAQKFGSLGWFGAVPRFLDYWLFGGSPGAIVIRFLLLLALLVASVPMVVRILRRRRRGKIASGKAGRSPEAGSAGSGDFDWGSDGAPAIAPGQDNERLRILAAWAEVRDSATDLGYAWPSVETPRQTAERIIKQARFTPSAQDAMDRMTGLAERANYARSMRSSSSAASAASAASASTTASTTLFDDVKTIRAGLAEPVSRRTRMRATVMPQSAMSALRERREDVTGHAYERIQKAGSRMRRSVGRTRKDAGADRHGGPRTGLGN